MKRLPIIVGSVAAVVALTLSSCASSAGPAANTENDDLFVIGVNALPTTISTDPWGGSASHTVLGGLGSQLLEYQRGATDEDTCETTLDEVTGRLAESAELNEDGTGVVLKLRDLTSQWGNKLSAEDVRWSMEAGFNRKSVIKSTLGKGGYDTDNMVTIIDDTTVQLNLTDVWSFTIASLQNNLAYIYDSTEAKKHVTPEDPTANEWLSKNLADYSGWILEEWSPESVLRLTADPNWGGERGTAKRIELRAVADDATRAQLLRSGELDVATSFEYAQYEALAEADGVSVKACHSDNRDTLMMNTEAEAVSDPRVRQAISMALDRDSIVTGAYTGFANASEAIFPPVASADSYEFNADGARKLLAEAGFPDGFDLTLTYSVSRPGPVATKSAILIQSQLAKVGINVELNNMASATDFSTAMIEGRYQALLYSEPLVILDPAFYSYAFYDTAGPGNSTGWSNANFDGLRLELASTPVENKAERAAILEKMAKLVHAEGGIIAIAEPKSMLATSDDVTGAVALPTGAVRFTELGRQ